LLSVSTLHYVIEQKYLTVGMICKYFIRLCLSPPCASWSSSGKIYKW